MSRIPDDLIEQVRDAADLVELIGRHVELKRTGADYRGSCPFHGGTHRNFAVIPKKGMYYCFVCHAAGDIFTFYMRRFGLDYPSAVREVASTVGIPIPDRAAAAGPDPQEPLLQAAAAAAEWYAGQLRERPEAEAARRYLEARGFVLEQVLPWGLGYAPQGTDVLEAMQRLGIGEDVLLEAGLAQRRDDGRVVPRLRGRLLFPIHDVRGRVVGFGGRVLGDREPKYLNSPDSPIFHKGRLLYHLHAAKQAIRQEERAILVEGYFDVLRLAVAGLDPVVAPLGTGLTAEQAGLLARYARQVVLLYDSDAAGLRATFRAGDVLLSAGLRVSVASLPEGEDPDSLVGRGGIAGLAPFLRDAIDFLERKLQLLERCGWLSSLKGRRRALDRLLPTLRAAQDPITRDLYLNRAAASVGIRPEVLARELLEHTGPTRGTRPERAASNPAEVRGEDVAGASAERLLVALWIDGEPWRARVRGAIRPDDFADPTYGALYAALEQGREPAALEPPLVDAYERARAALAGWEPDVVFEAAVNRIRARTLERELAELDALIPLAEAERQLELVAQKQRLSQALRTIMPRYKVVPRSPGHGARGGNSSERRGSASRS